MSRYYDEFGEGRPDALDDFYWDGQALRLKPTEQEEV